MIAQVIHTSLPTAKLVEAELVAETASRAKKALILENGCSKVPNKVFPSLATIYDRYDKSIFDGESTKNQDAFYKVFYRGLGFLVLNYPELARFYGKMIAMLPDDYNAKKASARGILSLEDLSPNERTAVKIKGVSKRADDIGSYLCDFGLPFITAGLDLFAMTNRSSFYIVDDVTFNQVYGREHGLRLKESGDFAKLAPSGAKALGTLIGLDNDCSYAPKYNINLHGWDVAIGPMARHFASWYEVAKHLGFDKNIAEHSWLLQGFAPTICSYVFKQITADRLTPGMMQTVPGFGTVASADRKKNWSSAVNWPYWSGQPAILHGRHDIPIKAWKGKTSNDFANASWRYISSVYPKVDMTGSDIVMFGYPTESTFNFNCDVDFNANRFETIGKSWMFSDQKAFVPYKTLATIFVNLMDGVSNTPPSTQTISDLGIGLFIKF